MFSPLAVSSYKVILLSYCITKSIINIGRKVIEPKDNSIRIYIL